jgi:hypothetical protein
VAAFFLRNWFGEYGHAYGGFGVSLALAAFVGIIASFWVWIAAVMGAWWERKAGPAAVAAMEELSADLGGHERQARPSAHPMGMTRNTGHESRMTEPRVSQRDSGRSEEGR